MVNLPKKVFSLHVHAKPSFAHRLQTAIMASSRTSAQNNSPRAQNILLYLSTWMLVQRNATFIIEYAGKKNILMPLYRSLGHRMLSNVKWRLKITTPVTLRPRLQFSFWFLTTNVRKKLWLIFLHLNCQILPFLR